MSKRSPILNKSMLAAPQTAAPDPAPSAEIPPARVRKEPSEYGEPLNFRVPPEFAMQFRMYALRKRMKLHQVLQRAFEVLLREEGGEGA